MPATNTACQSKSISAADQHAADLAPVAVGLAALGHGFSVGQQLGQVPLRCSPKRLPTFGCVDPVQADLVLAVVDVEQRDGVAVSDPNDAALEPVRSCVRRSDQAEQAQKRDTPEALPYSHSNAYRGGMAMGRLISLGVAGLVIFALLFVAMNTATGVVERALGLSGGLANAVFVGGILGAIGLTFVIVRTIAARISR